MIYAYSEQELEEIERCPPKQFIAVPLDGVDESSMTPERAKALMEWRQAVADFCESDPARIQAKKVIDLLAQARLAETQLHEMCDDKTREYSLKFLLTGNISQEEE